MIEFPRSNAPFIVHNRVSLSGNDCIEISQSLEKLKQQGVDPNDQRYTTLLSIFNFIVNYTKAKMGDRKKETYAASLERTALTEQATVFGPSQYNQLMIQIRALKHLMEYKPLPPQLQQCVRAFNSHSYDGKSGWEQGGSAQEREKDMGVVRDVVSRMRDPCTALADVLCGQLRPFNLDGNTTKKELQRLMNTQMSQRKEILKARIDEFKAARIEIPFEIRKEYRSLELLELQKTVRSQVVKAMPLELRTSGNFRLRKDIEGDRRGRERREKKNKMKNDREKRKTRKQFLSKVLEVYKKFTIMHRERKKELKKFAMGAQKKYDSVNRAEQEQAKQKERERLLALKSQDEEQYLKLLKEAKNERLLTLWRQTEEYMQKLGATIRKEKEDAAMEELSKEREKEEKEGKKKTPDDGVEIIEKAGETEKGKEEKEGDEKKKGEETVFDGETISRKKYYAIAHAIKEDIVEQPKLMKAGDLRAYQLYGLQWMVSLYNNHLNGILADEMGLGKTVQTLALLAYLMEKKGNKGPFLIIVPMSTLHNNWEYEFERWLPTFRKVIYDGNPHNRKLIRETQIGTGNFNVLLTTYEFAMRDKKYLKKIKWEYIIIDEAHRLKNPKCKLAHELAAYNKKSRRIALTGTPLQNELPELWSLLNFLHPSIFNSCHNFEKWFSSPFQDLGVANKNQQAPAVEMNEEEKLLVIDRLHSILRPFMLRREKAEVEKELPDKVEKVLRCQLTEVQRLLYHSIVTLRVKMHNTMVQLRKVCNHPYLFHPFVRGIAGSSSYAIDNDIVRLCGKFALMDQILPKLRATGHRVLMFNQMTKVMDILEQYFQLRDFPYLRLDGNTATAERSRCLQLFNAPDSKYFIFILSTKAGGLGLNLQSADTVILLDSDWNPQNDLQAQARAHRIGQKNQVFVLRLITSGTVEEKILSTAYNKLDTEEMVIKAGMFHNKYKAGQSRDMLQKVMREQHGEDSYDVMDDVEVSKCLARNPEEHEIFRKMDREREKNRLQAGYDAERSFPPGKIPRWIHEWCSDGGRSKSFDAELVNYNEQEFFGETPPDEKAPSLELDQPRVRRPKQYVNYNDNEMERGEEEEEEGKDDDDKDDEEDSKKKGKKGKRAATSPSNAKSVKKRRSKQEKEKDKPSETKKKEKDDKDKAKKRKREPETQSKKNENKRRSSKQSDVIAVDSFDSSTKVKEDGEQTKETSATPIEKETKKKRAIPKKPTPSTTTSKKKKSKDQ